jgi:hypothetical protein
MPLIFRDCLICRRASQGGRAAHCRCRVAAHEVRSAAAHPAPTISPSHFYMAQTPKFTPEYKGFVVLASIRGFGTKKRQLSFGRQGMHDGGDAWTLFR